MRVIFIVLTLAVGLATCTFIGGCEIIKHTKKTVSDSTSVRKFTDTSSSNITTGHVTTNETKSKGEYERTTYIYPARDTNIINFRIPPQVVIHETGTNEQTSHTVDTSWYRLIEQRLITLNDSMNRKLANSSTDVQKQTKGLGLWLMILIAFGAFVVFQLLGYGIKNFRLVKK